ncbi:MAG: DsbE family thiol:disulfide interchange protein [Methylococcus sp.]|jgi:cytochrome c biogenesis protein CcmG/thiol:disulfide interchange protein DsbE|nr:MAG: DsbE family thiol:disulfide interchange protein [Methylococcus sp.]
MRFLIPLGVFLVMVIFLAIGLSLDPRNLPSPLIGKPAPTFQLSKVEEPSQALTPESFRGRVILLNVWASWCVSCRQEHPVLLELAQRQEVPIFGLNYKDQLTAARDWLSKFGNPYEASGFDQDGRVGIDLGVYGVPETFVIDKKGLIRMKHTGPVTPQALEKDILPLVERLKQEP